MKKILFSSLVVTLLAGCSVIGYDSGSALEHWRNYDSDRLASSQLSDKQALAVFYRTADYQAPAVNIYINGDYHTSLLEKGYNALPVCATNTLISTSYTNSKKFGNRTEGISQTLNAQQIAYFKASKDSAGNPIFERVSEEVAKVELNDLSGKVDHALSRVSPKNRCEIAQ